MIAASTPAAPSVARPWRQSSQPVTAETMKKSENPPSLMKCLPPLRIQPSPSRVARVVNTFGDLDEFTTEGVVEFTLNGRVGTGHGSHTGVHDIIERVPQNTPVRITLRSNVSPEHPFHLHGQFFQIVAPAARAQAEPGLKDVVRVRGSEAVTVLTYFENPGQWMVHCHIAEHAERGMMSELVVVPPSP